MGRVSGASEFAKRLDRHLCRTGAYKSEEVVLISNGAAWITNVADVLLADMNKTYILDMFHALEYASAALNALVTRDIMRKARLAQIKAQLLDTGKSIRSLRTCDRIVIGTRMWPSVSTTSMPIRIECATMHTGYAAWRLGVGK